MITIIQKISSLILHILSFICECLVLYINKNSHIKLLCIYDIAQHLLKIIRIVIFGYEFIGSPLWICILYSFTYHFTHNGSLIISCMYINIYIYIFFFFFFFFLIYINQLLYIKNKNIMYIYIYLIYLSFLFI